MDSSSLLHYIYSTAGSVFTKQLCVSILKGLNVYIVPFYVCSVRFIRRHVFKLGAVA